MRKHWALTLAASFAAAAMAVGCHNMKHDKHHEEEEDEGDEVKMTIDQVPPAVKATLLQQAGGATIKTVDQEHPKSGKVVYETDVMSGGQNWEIRVAEDGTLISKKVDKEEDEKGKKEDDEKEEHEKK